MRQEEPRPRAGDKGPAKDEKAQSGGGGDREGGVGDQFLLGSTFLPASLHTSFLWMSVQLPLSLFSWEEQIVAPVRDPSFQRAAFLVYFISH